MQLRPTSKAIALASLICLLIPQASMADFGRGFQAWDKGKYREALREFESAAKAGDARAQNHLAQMYEDGQGTSINIQRAVDWYERAAAAGEPAAQLNLGRLYRSGKGVAQSDAQAVRWYKAAAEQGLGIAQFFMGLMYDTGKGVPSDYVRAYKWFALAARQGDADARHKRDRLANHMTPSQVLQAERLTREFLGEQVAQTSASTAQSGGPERTSATPQMQVALARPANEVGLPATRSAKSAAQGRSSGTVLGRQGVVEAQSLLSKLGYNAGEPDGVVGNSTRAAAMRFRSDTQQVGTDINAELLQQLRGVASRLPPQPSPPSSGAPLIRRIQEALTNLGYAPGSADGITGSKTVSAARLYRSELALAPSDALDQDLLITLEQRVRVREAARSRRQQGQAAAAISSAATTTPAAPAPTTARVSTNSKTPKLADVPRGKELVKRIQNGLNQLGYDAGTPDGVAGGATRNAISTFEREVGLPQTGAVSAKLLGRLEQRVDELPKPKVFAPPANERERVERIQRALSKLGFDAGSPDGVAGDQTDAAIKRFQTRAKLTRDGNTSDALLKRLETPQLTSEAGPRLRMVRPASEREMVRRIQVRL
ncbi:MAG: peptidoglycan hydrolase-like protein with peptidoglycan-binding domain, partial [Gammaproteobacteria bacterium]